MNGNAPDSHDRARGALLGLAAGDAVGTTVEFEPRGSFSPVTDMVGGGPYRLAPGQWTDDTSMALCLATSLAECGAFDAHDQMQRYLRWSDTGYLSSTGACFDIGNTVSGALERFRQSDDPWSGSTDPRSAGNGSLMRLAPVVLFAFPHGPRAEDLAARSSRTTHGAAECLDACRLFAGLLVRALRGEGKEDVLLGGGEVFDGEAAIVSIARGAWAGKHRDEIRGSGYVVESLEAALWCFAKTESFEEAILTAANLGDDADTTAAICGQLAGAFYGVEGIPARWREHLVRHDEMIELADRLLDSGGRP